MKISFVQPRPELQQLIESLWVFESPSGMPATDTSMAAPNGCPKLVIPYENSLVATWEGRDHLTREQGLYLVGHIDTSVFLRSEVRKTGNIVVEFAPHGAYPFFGIPMHETANGLHEADVVFGKWGRDIRETLRNLEAVGQKVAFIQEQLARLLRNKPRDNGLVHFCVESLKNRDGRITIRELEQRTGYSRRYLDLLFQKHAGLSPKALARIFRFQKFYRKWAQGSPYEVLKREYGDDYYDQAHFTKEFKRMTGFSPRQYAYEVPNEFGRRITLK
jgi:AraC-like DNA-binding protein